MKKILLCLMILVVSMTSFSQQIDTSKIDTSKINTRKYYLNKSRRQLIGGFILLGIAGTTVALINTGKISLGAGPILAIGIVLCVVTGIPILIESGRNKRKALRATTYLKLEKVPILQQTVNNFHSYPAISVKINL